MNNRRTNSKRGGKSNARKRRTNRRRNGIRNTGFRNRSIRVRNEAARFLPPTFVRTLRWNDQTLNRGHIGSQALNFYIRSSAYDPDVGFGTGAIPGFNEFAAFYESYCVKAMICRCEWGNQEGNPIVVGVLPSNLAFNVNSLTSSDIVEYLANPGGVKKFLGSNNAISIKRTNCCADGVDLLSKRVRTDVTFSASTSANPSVMFYLNYMAYNPAGNFGYNIAMSNTVDYVIEFFDRRPLES